MRSLKFALHRNRFFPCFNRSLAELRTSFYTSHLKASRLWKRVGHGKIEFVFPVLLHGAARTSCCVERGRGMENLRGRYNNEFLKLLKVNRKYCYYQIQHNFWLGDQLEHLVIWGTLLICDIFGGTYVRIPF